MLPPGITGYSCSPTRRRIGSGAGWAWIPMNRFHRSSLTPCARMSCMPASFLRGLYLSEDGGRNWRLHNNGLSVRSVRSLAISADGNTLYAGTEGGGVYRLSSLSPDDWQSLEPTATPLPTATATQTPTTRPTTTELPTLTATSLPAAPTPTQQPPPPTSRTSCPASFIPLAVALGWTVFRPLKTRILKLIVWPTTHR